jgi:hypothetical protein
MILLQEKTARSLMRIMREMLTKLLTDAHSPLRIRPR